MTPLNFLLPTKRRVNSPDPQLRSIITCAQHNILFKNKLTDGNPRPMYMHETAWQHWFDNHEHATGHMIVTGRGCTCPYAGLRNSIDSLNSSSAPAGPAQHDSTVNGAI